LDPKLAARLTERLARLTEAGRVLSSSNEKAVRAAIAALQAVLSKVAGGEPVEASESDAALATARDLLESEMSHNETYRALMKSVRALAPLGGYAWIRDVFDAYVVFDVETTSESQLYRADYTLGDDGQAALGTPAEVVARTVYEPTSGGGAATVSAAAESAPASTAEARQVEVTGPLLQLTEKALQADGTVPIKIIQPGWGSSGYYPANVLERDGPKVFLKGTHMYLDHPTMSEDSERPERSVKDLAAVLETDARWDSKGAAGPGLYADARPLNGFGEALNDIAPHIGVSIRAMGTATAGEAEGEIGPIIETLVAAKSVDFVTHAGAGGAVLSLLESARERRAHPPTPGGSTVDEKTAQALQESNTAMTKRLEETERELARLREGDLLREARSLVTAALTGIDLPDVTRARLIESLAKNPPVKEDRTLDAEKLAESVKAAAAEEIAYLEKAAGYGTGQIRGMGSAGTPRAELDEAKSGELMESAFARLLGSDSAAKVAATSR
jgi:hypothetical protein